MTQQRQAKRQSLRLPVSLGGKLPALALDVSTDGFRVELPQVFLPGSRVDGYVLEGERSLFFRGEVAWARPGDPRLSVLSEMGIHFDALDPELKKLLGKKRRTRKPAAKAKATKSRAKSKSSQAA